MEIGEDADAGEREEFGPGPLDGLSHMTKDAEFPAVEVDGGRAAGVEHRPLLCSGLSGGQAVLPESVRADNRALRGGGGRGDFVTLIFRSIHEEAHWCRWIQLSLTGRTGGRLLPSRASRYTDLFK